MYDSSGVEIALDNLNETEIRPGFKVTIENAKFEQKGDYKLREKREIDEIAKIKFKVNQEKMFSWNDTEEGEGLRIVVIKHMFTPEEVIVLFSNSGRPDSGPEFGGSSERRVRVEDRCGEADHCA